MANKVLIYLKNKKQKQVESEREREERMLASGHQISSTSLPLDAEFRRGHATGRGESHMLPDCDCQVQISAPRGASKT